MVIGSDNIPPKMGQDFKFLS